MRASCTTNFNVAVFMWKFSRREAVGWSAWLGPRNCFLKSLLEGVIPNLPTTGFFGQDDPLPPCSFAVEGGFEGDLLIIAIRPSLRAMVSRNLVKHSGASAT